MPQGRTGISLTTETDELTTSSFTAPSFRCHHSGTNHSYPSRRLRAVSKIWDSESEEKEVNVEELLADLAALRLENKHYDKDLEQAQGKVILLAAALHSTCNLFGEDRESMVQ